MRNIESGLCQNKVRLDEGLVRFSVTAPRPPLPNVADGFLRDAKVFGQQLGRVTFLLNPLLKNIDHLLGIQLHSLRHKFRAGDARRLHDAFGLEGILVNQGIGIWAVIEILEWQLYVTVCRQNGRLGGFCPVVASVAVEIVDKGDMSSESLNRVKFLLQQKREIVSILSRCIWQQIHASFCPAVALVAVEIVDKGDMSSESLNRVKFLLQQKREIVSILIRCIWQQIHASFCPAVALVAVEIVDKGDMSSESLNRVKFLLQQKREVVSICMCVSVCVCVSILIRCIWQQIHARRQRQQAVSKYT